MFWFRLIPDRTALCGALAVGVVIAVSSAAIVRAERMNPDKSKTYNCSSGTACVEGSSSDSKTWGVYGFSLAADGVHGVTSSASGNSAVAGIATGTSGSAHGVFGKSSNGDGVYGTSSSANGVEGHSQSTSAQSAGVAGFGTDWGVYGKGYVGVIGESSASAAMFAQSDGTSTYIFYGQSTYAHSCGIDYDANLTCTGKITGGSTLRTRHRNSGGQAVLAYAAESATATIEDVGTARLVSGVATVEIGRDFASVMDRGWYYVFITPLGESRGLYMSAQTESAFQVRENERGRDTLAFNYRIVARPCDGERDRLPPAPPPVPLRTAP